MFAQNANKAVRPCDRVVQAAVKIVIEPVFEADRQPGSIRVSPKRPRTTP